ncbi:hypothetical protein NBRC116188_01040 [Oceaniserpentilla sp. 4NH20-0058]|uniref:EAL domain-containing protein n=1 Tax=Oceaniserpentilla sp. 4NH20-0058 TaxID=3127660 RepID=UPI00310C2F75
MSIRLFVVLMFLSCLATAMEVGSEDKITINQFEYFIDSNHHYSPQTIDNSTNLKWTEINQTSINLGYEQSTVWIKFHITNSLTSNRDYLLDINYPLLDYIDLYERRNKQYHTLIHSGDGRPFDSRDFKHPNFVTAIKLTPNETKSFLIKVRSNAPIQTEVLLWSPNEFQNFYRSKASITFLYLGVLLSTALFNLVVFLFIKERTFLAYGLYATSFALLMTSQDAILFEYIFPNHPKYHNWAQLILGASTLSLTCLFNLLFLKLNKSSNGKLLYLMSFVPIGIVLSSVIIGYSMAIKLLISSILLIIPLCFMIGVIHSKNNENRIFYLVAWSWLFIGVIIFIFSKLGYIPFNLFTNHAIQLGSALELLTFAIALAKRLHTEKETRIQAQQIIIDSTKQSAKFQQELLYNATHNDITGFPNRNLFSRELETLIKTENSFTVVLLHLSRISELDKTLGREISNYVLEQVSINLNSYIHHMENIQCLDKLEEFYAANLSNSTFSFVIKNNKKQEVDQVLQSLAHKINKPILVNELLIDPWVTQGYAIYPEHGKSASLLLRNATIALDHADTKESGISYYHTDQDTYNERRLILINELKPAISTNKMQLLYQPLINTNSEAIIGAEALIRWPHEDYGVVLPDEFIEIAEQTGIIQALSLWVFKNALNQLKLWLKMNPNFLMSVNISAHNIKNKEFIRAILLLISDTPNIAKNIILELTESQMMGDTQHTLENLWSLSEHGFNIAIDDFGTGYSNLSYLKKLPANELKIDKTFILNLESDKQNQVLVQTAIQMAHNLGLKIVAEGVESEKCRAILETMQCDMCQGFHFSKPISAKQFSILIDKP